ncbi:hypothetical protein FRB96_006921 [Tulasnella sp. 330]|nr:hypothetical protein FRB96_006921 [Tulasnella sp. 330]KAG8875815.1 hypothetical protein FRB97_004703 [Tulasnella sp. 331]KAG8881171.1 hypothetical protein FRB98_004522 [Tulasnella sp. 332]
MPHPRNPHQRRNGNQNQNQNHNQSQQDQQDQQHYDQNTNGNERERLTQDPQDVMSTAIRLQWNIRVLQRHDPQITSIVDQFTYVVLYRFDGERWVKRGVEGSMFFYTRTDPPRHGFCILNREGIGNFVQPLRRGDEMAVTAEYIIYRPANVDVENFENLFGIWTSDLVERKHLNEFMLKIQDHVSATDVPYSPVLLHQPLERPEDAKLPLITPLPPPPTGHAQASPQPKKNKRQKQPNQKPTPSPVAQPQVAQVQAPPPPPPAPAASGEPLVTVDSLFSKFVSPHPPASTSPPPAGTNGSSAELRGPALLQTMFASAAASGGVGGLFSTSTSTSETKTIMAPGGGKETVSRETVITSTSVSLPPDVSATTPVGQGKENGEEGVVQGNMLKQLLGISAPSPSSNSSPRSPSPPGQSLHVDASGTPSRSGSIPPTFKPINEDEEGTPPRIQTPPNTDAFGAVRISVKTTPTPQSKRKSNGMAQQPATPNINRDLVAYDFENGDAPQGMASPWAPLQQQQARTDAPHPPPSPSMLPKPRGVREKRGGGGGGKNNGTRRDGSPVPRAQQHQRQHSTASASNSPAPGTPKKTYVPKNDATEEGARRIHKDLAADVLLSAMKNGGDGRLKGGLSKETFVQELLALIHRKSDFVDVLYEKYSEATGLKDASSHDPNTVDLRD